MRSSSGRQPPCRQMPATSCRARSSWPGRCAGCWPCSWDSDDAPTRPPPPELTDAAGSDGEAPPRSLRRAGVEVSTFEEQAAVIGGPPLRGSGMQHGAESFFIEGEGLVDASLGGRSGAEPDRVDAANAAGPSLPVGDPPPFRFSRIGPKGRQLNDRTRLRIAAAMIEQGKAHSRIPAGFTYLGQFVDHDLTADRTAVEMGEHVSPAELLQGRSPKLDLDSLYGAGPGDEESERFYAADGVHLKVGRTLEDDPGDGFDLPRL